jgi:hypothetical protein
MTKAGPSADLVRLVDSLDTTLSGVVWGTEGTGKTLFVLRDWPLPILVLNLDRALTRAHLYDPVSGKPLPQERLDNIFVKNMREDITAVDHMQAVQIKNGIEDILTRNLDWLKGGTLLLDGGTMFRSVLKMADQTIAKAIEAGKRWNPREKEQVNVYHGALISRVADAGINFVITAHAAFEWKMVQTEGADRPQLTRMHTLYPKFDDIAFERTAFSILLFKRCECGRNIVNQDGSCSAAGTGESKHVGRIHVARIVNNKYNTSTEGKEFVNLSYRLLHTLAFDREKAALL